ncbi:hypothetical protein Pint_02769 [Pistacia integerrima]|uniref:Uncharacterized protein n=1 Tax=Pistacia integerrima TaxID=434235 RepID=A0ACC0ZN66_9ROSI|nr:hypothetical protein Pint_02769 [Pistacia integerrima]
MHFSALTWLFLFLLFHVSHSDPRISEAALFCGTNITKTSNYVPTFVREMENLSQVITTTHFATYHVNLSTTNNHTRNSSSSSSIYALTQCHRDLSQTDCLLCYAAARTTVPRCLPSLSARIFLDGCFLRYDSYKFYKEYVSPALDNVTCSKENVSFANYENENEFLTSVGYAVGNVTRRAVRTGSGGFGTAEVEGVYALAQCWESVGQDGCRRCLEKAGKGVRGCGLKREGRSLNTGCYLRYSNKKFFNDDGPDEDSHVSGLGITIAISLATAAFIMVFLFAAYASYTRIKKMKEGTKYLLFGYMAPEYLVRGQLTEKADVYSFGVLVLEIVCGRRNNLYSQDHISPLQTVWTLYRLNNLMEAVDSSLKEEFHVEEANKVLQIGLLCTQAEVALRPSMAQVVWMLTSKNCEIPIPHQPPFMSTNVTKPEGSTRTHNTNSFIANAARKMELSYTSTESSSMPSSIWAFKKWGINQKVNSRTRDIEAKDFICQHFEQSIYTRSLVF